MSPAKPLRLIPVSQPTYRVADPADVEREVRDWDDSVLECRTYNHTWAPQRAVWNAEYRYYHIVQICPRCRSERTMDMNMRGHLLSKPVIHYADGYLSQGLGRIYGDAKDVVRLAAVTRTFPLEKLTGKKARNELPRSAAARAALGQEAG